MIVRADFGRGLARQTYLVREELLSAIGIVLLLWWVYEATGQFMLEILWEQMPRLV